MRKLSYFLIIVVLIAGTGWLLMQNKAKSKEKLQLPVNKDVAVKVDTISYQKIADQLTITGTLFPQHEVFVIPEGQGRVTQVFFKIGESKKSGELLAKIDDELLQAQLVTAQANYDKCQKDYERFEALYKEGASTEVIVENARLGFKNAEAQLTVAKRQLKNTNITAPFAGVITMKNIEIGSMASNNTPIAQIVDVSTLKVRLNVGENDVFQLKKGEKVEVLTDVFPGTPYFGIISFISEKGDEGHTYPIEIELINQKEKPLKAGMFVKVKFASITKNEVLTIPRSALLGSYKDPKVFVIENKTAQEKSIIVGNTYEDKIEVVSGLNKNEFVVVNGNHNLKTGTKVTIIP